MRRPNYERTARLAAAVTVAAWAVYLLTASGRLQIGADESVVYATADSLARYGRFDIDQLASVGKGEVWDYGMWGRDGHQYGKYGPAHTLIAAPFIWLALRLPAIYPVDTTLLFNTIVTALTVGLVFWTASQLSYSDTTALAAAGLYGFGTFAWPYSKTFFGEPLSALGILAAVAWAIRTRATRRWSSAILAGFALGLATAVKWSNAVVAPIILLFLWVTLPSTRRLRLVLAWAAGPAVSVVLLLLFNAARFGSLLETGYGAEPGFTTPVSQGLAGLLLSPGKSWFLYAPILLLAVPGAWWMWKRDHAVTVLLVASVLAQLLLYATWWAWWGGWGWGPRLLLPATPFLILLTLPVLHRAMESTRHPWTTAAVVALALVSLAVQLEGIAVHYATYLGVQTQRDPLVNSETIWDPAQSPLAGQLRYLRTPHWDFAWFLDGTVDALHLLAKLGFVAAAGLTLRLAWQGRARRLLLPLTATGLVVAAFGLARTSSASADNYGAVARSLAAEAPDLIVLSDYARQSSFWNFTEKPVKVIGAPESAPPPPRVQRRLASELRDLATTGAHVVHLAQNPPGHPDSGIERWLAANLYAAGHTWYGTTRWNDFAQPAAGADHWTGDVQVQFGQSISLDAFEVHRTADAVYVSLAWRAREAMARSYAVSVQLLGETSQVMAQHDGEPAAATRPTTTWQPGEEIVDRRALLADGRQGGDLIVVVYDPATGERLSVTASDSRELGDSYTLVRLPAGQG